MIKLRWIVIPLVVAAFLVSCSPTNEPVEVGANLNSPEAIQDIPTPTDEPMEMATETIPETPPETIAPTETAVVTPSSTPIPTETPEEITGVLDACLDCHKDKERLIETAAPEEKAPSESSGVG